MALSTACRGVTRHATSCQRTGRLALATLSAALLFSLCLPFRAEAQVLSASQAVELLILNRVLEGAGETFRIPVDPSLDRISFELSGSSPSLSVRRPDGTLVGGSESNVFTETEPDRRLFVVVDPTPGEWRVTAIASGLATLSVTGQGAIDLLRAEFVADFNGGMHEGLVALPGRPATGTTATLLVELTAGFQNPVFEFRDLEGITRETFPLAPASGRDARTVHW
jgi:hypothetical protein